MVININELNKILENKKKQKEKEKMYKNKLKEFQIELFNKKKLSWEKYKNIPYYSIPIFIFKRSFFVYFFSFVPSYLFLKFN